jgi:hypothetical protein
VRRCAETWRDGRFVLAQQTNVIGGVVLIALVRSDAHRWE